MGYSRKQLREHAETAEVSLPFEVPWAFSGMSVSGFAFRDASKDLTKNVDAPSFLRYAQSTVNYDLHEWQRDHLIPLLDSLGHTTGRRILIHAPPQFGKSVWVSQRFPAWLMGIDPAHRVRLACFNITKASEFGAAITDLMQAPEFEQAFGSASRIPKDASRESFRTEARRILMDAHPSFKALGIQTGFTGTGVDTLIIDDPYPSEQKAESESYERSIERFWTGTAVPRLNEQTNVLVMFHRYHKGDFAQRRIDEGGWEYYRFPALADENEDGSDPTGREIGEPLSPMRSKAYLLERQSEDPLMFAGQFQGNPATKTGNTFIESDFEYIVDRVPRLAKWVRCWDLATTVKQRNDETAGVLAGMEDDGTIVLADLKHWRREWPETRDGFMDENGIIHPGIIQIAADDMNWAKSLHVQALGETAAQYEVGIESTAMQLALVQDVQRNDLFLKIPLWGTTPPGDKKQRASVWAARARAGKLKLVRGAWNAAFIKQCLAFDGLGLLHDDLVDCVSAAVELLYKTRGGEVKAKPRPIPNSPDFYAQLERSQRRKTA